MSKTFQKFLSMVLCCALLLAYLPATTPAVAAEVEITHSVADPGTAASWKNMLGTTADGNRYAGRVWADRSVYTDGATAVLSDTNSVEVKLQKDELFQVIYSVLGSSMSTTTTTSSVGPMDVVLILDNSVSMNTTSGGVTRMERVIDAANGLLQELLQNYDVRVGITAYAQSAQTVLPFGTYAGGVQLRVDSYTGNNGGTITAYGSNGRPINNSYHSDGYAMYTNIQAGFDLGMAMLENATDINGRKPVVILLTDGAANTAVDSSFYDISQGRTRQVYHSNNIDPMIALSTLLSTAYHKASVAAHYKQSPVVYGVGVDLSATDGSNAIINPKDNFNSGNTNANIRTAYAQYTDVWSKGQTVTMSSGGYRFTFDHNYPASSGITDREVMANIHYVDTYYNANSEQVEEIFDQIYNEITSNAFNPITSTRQEAGGTGETDTPLLYVDFIGQFLQVKQISSVSLFGATYSVNKGSAYAATENGEAVTITPYTVAAGSGTNPTTNEGWNTANNIRIRVIEYADSTQKLEVEIDQQILPIILEKVDATTVGDAESATIVELLQDPLRVFYTVGIHEDILLPSGAVDITKLGDYAYVDRENGTVDFYSAMFGKMNPAEDGVVTRGDAHVGFQPSAENRYYYNQTNQGIFVDVQATNGAAIDWDESEYGVVWQEGKYDLTWMHYNDYLAAADNDQVYTYVSYYHPTPSTTDKADAAEYVTYLVYSQWKYMKNSLGFYDASAQKYINYDSATNSYYLDDVGYVMTADQIAAYVAANGSTNVYAVLGVGGMRTSRLHNMAVEKSANGNLSGTATNAYTPVFLTTDEEQSTHHDNDVVIWLGNNAKATAPLETGLTLTKEVTEPIGKETDTYAVTVQLPTGTSATPMVTDKNGTAVDFTYQDHLLTVPLLAGQTVYVTGIPAGTVCTIGEIIPADAEYFASSRTEQVTVPSVADVLEGRASQYAAAKVVNTPSKYGALFITKEIESDHPLPSAIAEQSFAILVDFGAELRGQEFPVRAEGAEDTTLVLDDTGKATLSLKATQTVEILNIPFGTEVAVSEALTEAQAAIFTAAVSYDEGITTVPNGGHVTAVVTNTYTPVATGVTVDILGTKTFLIDNALTEQATFTFLVERWNAQTAGWEAVIGGDGQPVTAAVAFEAGEVGTAEKTFAVTDLLQQVSYTKETVDTYRITEQAGSVAGVTYDTTVHTFTVTVTDVDGKLQAAVAGHHADSVRAEDGKWTVLPRFENSYNSIEVTLDVEKQAKDNVGNAIAGKAGFTFRAVETDEAWAALDGGMVKTEISDGTGSARFTAVYKEPTTRYFVVSEVNDGRPGWRYDATQYHITLAITRDETTGDLQAATTVVTVKNGQQTATETFGAGSKVSFQNTYAPSAAQVDLNGAVKKTLTQPELMARFAHKFTFAVYKAGTTEEVLRATADAEGNVALGSLSFSHTGVYRYDVAELQGSLPGITYDTTRYHLVVEVTDNGQGSLSALYYFENALGQTVTFTNSYTVKPTQYAIHGNKVLHNRALKADEFAFELYEGETPVQQTTVKADGSFTFDAIPYTKAGTYTYTVKEAAGNVPGVTYSGVDTPVTVTLVVDDVDSQLTVTSVTYSAGQSAVDALTFENTYTAKAASVAFRGTKTLVGGQLRDGDFTFHLYQTDSSFAVGGTPVAIAENVGDAFRFGAISFSRAGDYFFVVVEDATDARHDIVYDATQHRFHVQVADNGLGQLEVVVHDLTGNTTTMPAAGASATVAFTNATFASATEKSVSRQSDTTTRIDGQRVAAGEVLTYYITYTNYTGSDVQLNILDTIPQHTAYVEGSASHGGAYAVDHVLWVLDVAKGDTVTVSFDVTVLDEDAIFANTATLRDGTNTYTTNQVVNHTVKPVLQKDVFAAADPTTSIEGQKVAGGDELLYTIRFTNLTSADREVTITDLIPENTSYVEGSADLGGVYQDGKLTWVIAELKAWSSVTVSFKVKVHAVNGVTITNVASAFDGTNTFESNSTTNHIPKAKDPTSPQTGDTAQVTLWLFTAALSLTAFVGMIVFRKKEN